MFSRKGVFTQFELNIEGYQFPHLAKDQNDGNWLNVNIRVKHPKGGWQRTDPCLETFELKWLIQWFEKITKNEEVEKHLYFTEPCLEFELLRSEKGNKFRVFFSHELAPPWIKDFREEFFIDFVVTEKELKRVIADLKKDLEMFPARGEFTDD